MPDLEREDLAAFVSLWSRTLVTAGSFTLSTFKVIGALQELAALGGELKVPPAPNYDENVADASER